MEHPDKLTLQRFLDGNLSLFMRMRVKRHVGNCSECQQALLAEQEEQRQQNEFINGISMLEDAENEAEKHSHFQKDKTR